MYNSNVPLFLLPLSILFALYSLTGAVCMTDKYDKNYWMKKNDLGFVTGAVANAFVDWIPQANLTFSRYNLWNIKSQFPAADLAYSFTCADFVWAAAAKLLGLSAFVFESFSPPPVVGN